MSNINMKDSCCCRAEFKISSENYPFVIAQYDKFLKAHATCRDKWQPNPEPIGVSTDEMIKNMDDLIKLLAAHEHEQWAHWTKYMLKQLGWYGQGEVTNKHVKRWIRQIETPYNQLPKDETMSDRTWAIKTFNIIKTALRGQE
jgi:hypothetical protein